MGFEKGEKTKTPEELQIEIEQLKLENEFLTRENRRLEELATKDTLTGLYNRRGFEEAMEKIAPEVATDEERRREDHPSISILALDLDNFKEINDLYGHDAGDEVLKRLAEFLTTETRSRDIVARLGGEEFVVAFNGAEEQDVVNKFYNKEDKRPEINFETEIKGERVKVTLSGGVTNLKLGEDIKSTLKRADKALYVSKEAGKDRITKYSELEEKEVS